MNFNVILPWNKKSPRSIITINSSLITFLTPYVYLFYGAERTSVIGEECRTILRKAQLRNGGHRIRTGTKTIIESLLSKPSSWETLFRSRSSMHFFLIHRQVRNENSVFKTYSMSLSAKVTWLFHDWVSKVFWMRGIFSSRWLCFWIDWHFLPFIALHKINCF